MIIMKRLIALVMLVVACGLCMAPKMIGEHVTIDYDNLGDVLTFESYLFPRDYTWSTGYNAYERYILHRTEFLLRQVANTHKYTLYGHVEIHLYKRMGDYPGFYIPATNRIYLSVYDLYYRPTLLAHEFSHFVQSSYGVPLNQQEPLALKTERIFK